MKTHFLPLAALIIGGILQLIMGLVGENTLPLLTLLFMSEFGLLLCIAGAWAGFKHGRGASKDPRLLPAAFLCVLLAVAFAIEGYVIWQGVQASLE